MLAVTRKLGSGGWRRRRRLDYDDVIVIVFLLIAPTAAAVATGEVDELCAGDTRLVIFPTIHRRHRRCSARPCRRACPELIAIADGGDGDMLEFRRNVTLIVRKVVEGFQSDENSWAKDALKMKLRGGSAGVKSPVMLRCEMYTCSTVKGWPEFVATPQILAYLSLQGKGSSRYLQHFRHHAHQLGF